MEPITVDLFEFYLVCFFAFTSQVYVNLTFSLSHCDIISHTCNMGIQYLSIRTLSILRSDRCRRSLVLRGDPNIVMFSMFLGGAMLLSLSHRDIFSHI